MVATEALVIDTDVALGTATYKYLGFGERING